VDPQIADLKAGSRCRARRLRRHVGHARESELLIASIVSRPNAWGGPVVGGQIASTVKLL